MITRYDTAPINGLTVDQQTGFLHASDVPIARAGVFPYLKGDGSIDMEAKLPADILNSATVQSANNKPVTEDHPTDSNGNNISVNSDNSNALMKGFTANNAHVDGDTLKVDMTITDDSLINAVNNGKQELSIGFQTNVLPQSGEYNGMKYDSVQKDIQINHVAVVDRAREGHNIRITGDSAEMVTEDLKHRKDNQMEEFTTVRLGDSDIRVKKADADTATSANSALASLQKQVATLKQQNADLQAQLDKANGNADSSKQDAENNKKDADQAKAKADALEKKLAKFDGDSFDKAVMARTDLITKAKKFLGDSYDFAGKDDRTIKVDSIKKIDDSFDATDKSDDYINAYFDMSKPSAVVGVTSETKGDAMDNIKKLQAARDNLFYANKGGNN